MIVFTGLSGSGKSSLAFDTIFAEGQRRYIESLSAYARQFLGGMQKPDVDEIEGLSPAISIDQKAHSANPRSTVATITEIYDYLRVLFARVGEPHCPIDGVKISKLTTDEMVERIKKEISNKQSKQGKQSKQINELIIFSPIVRGRKGEYYQMLYDIYNSGYLEVRVDGEMKSLRERIILEKNNKHTIEVVVDKFNLIRPEYSIDLYRQRVTDAVEIALELSDGFAILTEVTDDGFFRGVEHERQSFCVFSGSNLHKRERSEHSLYK